MKMVGKTDIGLVRASNQDSFATRINQDGHYLGVVCDGIGGGNAGDVASALAVSTLIHDFDLRPSLSNEDEVKTWIRKTVEHCNEVIYRQGMTSKKYQGMGTTLVGVLVTHTSTYVFNVGDSRAYGFYDDLVCLTEDHNLLQELIHTGQLSEEQARAQMNRNILTNALGIWDQVRVDIYEVNNSYESILLCSDGLHGYVKEDLIRDILLKPLSVEEKVQLMIHAAYVEGAYDNITVVILEKEAIDYDK